MKTLIINESNITEYDSMMQKARALIFDEENNMYICNMNGSFVLPGGTIESNETPKETLIRELDEEMGLKKINNIEELIKIDYYHANFPKYKSEGYDKRLNIVYYFLIKIKKSDLGKSCFTEYEKSHNEKIECYSIEEITKLLNLPSDNKWKKFTDIELFSILHYYSSLNQEKAEHKNKK